MIAINETQCKNLKCHFNRIQDQEYFIDQYQKLRRVLISWIFTHHNETVQQDNEYRNVVKRISIDDHLGQQIDVNQRFPDSFP